MKKAASNESNGAESAVGASDNDLRILHAALETYWHSRRPDHHEESGKPLAPVVVSAGPGGVCIELGTDRFCDTRAPDVQIERRPGGWAIFLHPLGGSDACGVVYFTDDGRSYFQRETDGGPTPAIEIVPTGDKVPEFDEED